jgi:ankyrin repeat protein
VNIKDDLLLAKDSDDQTAWHLASWNNRSDVIKQLLEYGEAELSQQDF